MTNPRTIHVSGTPGDALFYLPKKVRDGRVVEYYKRPAITSTVATHNTLLAALDGLHNVTISHALVVIESNFLLREEREILRAYVDAGWGGLTVGDVFDFSKFV